jgi:hypothetical protein
MVKQPAGEPDLNAMPDGDRESPAASASLRDTLLLTVGPLIAWCGLVTLARILGLAAVRGDARAALAFPPLAVRFEPRFRWPEILAAALALAILAAGPRIMAELRWRALLAVAFLAAAAWAVALALVDGANGLTGDVNYLHDVARVGSPIGFLRHFVANIATYTQHVRAHPPGFELLLWGMQRIGLGGAGVEAALVIAGGAAAVPAALLVVREVAGERTARSAAPFLVLAPIALWIATSADAFYMGVTAWSIALIVLATTRKGRRSDVLALGGGLLLGAALFLSYGVTVLALVPIGVAAVRRRIRALAIGAVGAAAVIAAFAWFGFWWPDGLHATLVQYRASAARFRPQSLFWLIDLGAFAIALGPATSVALARLRDPRLWRLVGAALIAVALADLSGWSRAEVERIWLPFAPWILVAGASLRGDRSGARPWLTLQAATCLFLQAMIKGP